MAEPHPLFAPEVVAGRWQDAPHQSDLDAPANFRDLGGLPTTDGRVVRAGVLFRSEFPHWLTADDATLPSLATVVDLRRYEEAELEDVDWAAHGVRRFQIPMIAAHVPFSEAHADAYLAADTGQLAEAVRAITRGGGLPAQFFCAAGKDRTGLVAVTLLDLLGVDRDAIRADFLATDHNMTSVGHRLARHPYYGDGFEDLPLSVFLTRPAALATVFSWLDDQGGAEAWANSIGITSAEVERFRAEALEPAGPAT